MLKQLIVIILIPIILVQCNDSIHTNIKVWGPGLNPNIVLPARYFFVQNYQDKLNVKDFNIVITGTTKNGNKCHIWTNILDRKDSSFIVRYKIYETCYGFQILVKLEKSNEEVVNYYYRGPIHPDECDCFQITIDNWISNAQCKANIHQIDIDLSQFKKINFDNLIGEMVTYFNKNPYSMSICQYVVKNNLIFRKCYGEYTGFKMFMDNLLLSLTRKVRLPDIEFFVNLGDWPLSTKNKKFPIFSWCGSNSSNDIVMPTYDITESSLENMGRVSLDMLSVQGNIDKEWSKKISKAFWMGRDSNKQRLKLIEISKQHPELINASITNFFFYKDLKEKYGPSSKPISFFKFFDYKYQLNLDGTVAAYRFPYLLAGNSLVFKQDSEFYEHFYNELVPWVHYIPVKKNLENLVDLLINMTLHDNEAKNISFNGFNYARKNLLPHNILCYYMLLFQEYSKLLVSKVEVRDDMEAVHSSKVNNRVNCDCNEAIDNVDKKLKLEL
ncbi:protein O-glucosyltransferase 2-like [Daktulosphaira vitifoliae]|uniref:protein O-glucosyltransferase 2-like n=1 Tax=Daktulosphaira vitifoliae TaxID=58002 RepID=UPI0021AB0999|nr:protein O-glucosyltransferase 2-like [Daktulosphaira vitifoliae]